MRDEHQCWIQKKSGEENQAAHAAAQKFTFAC